MTVRVEVSEAIDRPAAQVFKFYANEHVRNHPRWDPDVELEQVSDGPIGLGLLSAGATSAAAPSSRARWKRLSSNPIGRLELPSMMVPSKCLAIFEAASHDRTTLTISIELPRMDSSMDTSLLTGRMERSVRNIKHLIESEG